MLVITSDVLKHASVLFLLVSLYHFLIYNSQLIWFNDNPS